MKIATVDLETYWAVGHSLTKMSPRKYWAKTVKHIDERIREETKLHPQSCSANPNVYDVRDAVLNCDRKHLGSALAAIISRLHDEVEEV